MYIVLIHFSPPCHVFRNDLYLQKKLIKKRCGLMVRDSDSKSKGCEFESWSGRNCS